MKKLLALSFLLAVLLAVDPPDLSRAQEGEPSGPIYVVTEGDTLSSIALSFGVTVDDLVAANGLENANSLFVGDRLVIPGLEGITGILETASVAPGENLRSLSRTYSIPEATMIKLNRLVSPAELHAGASLVLTRSQGAADPYRVELAAGESLLETAVRSNANPWALANANNAATPLQTVPGDILVVSRSGDSGALGLPRPIQEIDINRLYQGEAGIIRVATSAAISLSGRLGPYDLVFMPGADNAYYALQGIHTLLDPGMYLLQLSLQQADGRKFDYAQYVKVRANDYIFEYINVDPSLIDPDTTAAEQAVIDPYLATVTPDKLWQGLFQAPSPFSDCINSTFGNRRSYNGSAFTYFHSGTDFCGGTGVEIYAPAPGKVIFTQLLTIRGNFTLIDHGWGVLTAYMHQSEVLVQVGDTVQTGQVIGLVGNTGRSTGPHLHWEVWVHGVAVNPLDWLATEYP